MKHEHLAVSEHQQLECFFNSLLRLTKRIELSLCEGNAECVSMSWKRHNVCDCITTIKSIKYTRKQINYIWFMLIMKKYILFFPWFITFNKKVGGCELNLKIKLHLKYRIHSSILRNIKGIFRRSSLIQIKHLSRELIHLGFEILFRFLAS